MLAMVIGAAFCSAPLAVLLLPLVSSRRPQHANDNFIGQGRPAEGRKIVPFLRRPLRGPTSLNGASQSKTTSACTDRAGGREELRGHL